MPGTNLRRAKNLIGTNCTGIVAHDGKFFIKFKVEISKKNEPAIAQLRMLCPESDFKRQKGKGTSSKQFVSGIVEVSKDPRNNGSLNLSEHYAREE